MFVCCARLAPLFSVMMRIQLALCFLCVLATNAFVMTPRTSPARHMAPLRVQETDTELGMPPSLATIVEVLRSVQDDRTRFKQLLFLAAQAEKMDESLKTPENKVQGCLSTVHVSAELRDGKVFYVGDSDGQMTKGLVAILTKGLSGNTAESIQLVKPEFIHYAGLGTSLTPGRNNGFINMLKKMKQQAEIVGGAADGTPDEESEKKPE